jgi:hypothetical protein
MKKHLSLLVSSSMMFASVAAQAQTPPSAPPPDAPAAAPNVPEAAPPEGALPLPVPPALPPPPPPAFEAAIPSTEDRLGTLEGKVDGMDESLAGTRSTVDKLARIKVSGYLQGRFEYHADSVNGLNSVGRPATTNQFLVRRGRLKTVYDGTNAEYLLQIDATGSGVVLKDAEATFVDTWSPFGFRLTVGQFKWPFGYEILQSSGDREMPERSLVIRRLFPGERDRGLRLTAKYEWLRVAAALVNGTGTQDPIYVNNDQNTFKDLVARVGGDFEWLVVGLSGYLGRATTTTTPTTRSSIAGTDKNMDGTITPDELTITSTPVPAAYKRFARKRLGADAQLYFDVPALGGLALKGEFVLAKDTNLDYGGVAANPCADALSLGWIATVVQNVGDFVGLVFRADYYDPVRSRSLPDSCVITTGSTMGQKIGTGDATTTLGGGLLLYGSGNIKGTFTYEHIAEQSVSVKNDIFTAQLQARF